MAAVTSRYSRAFADVISTSRLDPSRVIDAVESLVEIVHESPQLRELWSSPSVSHEEKLKLVDAIAQRLGMDRQSRNFVAVLIDHHRINLLPEIAQQLKAELNERMGFAEAEITSSRELSGDEKQLLEAQVAQATGKTIRARYSRDPQLLGGAIVKVGSTVFDGSVQGQLRRIREQIAAG